MDGLKVIVVGDTNSSGGKVITGSRIRSIQGKGIARLGDLVDCPARYPDGSLHGVNPIVEGEASNLIDSIPSALHGHKTACGCTLVGSMPVRVTPKAPASAQSTTAGTAPSYSGQGNANSSAITPNQPVSQFDQYFSVLDQSSHKPAPLFYYGLKAPAGEHHSTLYADGATAKAFSTQAKTVELLYLAQSQVGVRT